jgi:hypothetical protein
MWKNSHWEKTTPPGKGSNPLAETLILFAHDFFKNLIKWSLLKKKDLALFIF